MSDFLLLREKQKAPAGAAPVLYVYVNRLLSTSAAFDLSSVSFDHAEQTEMFVVQLAERTTVMVV